MPLNKLKKKLQSILADGNQAEVMRKGFVYIILRVLGLLLGYYFTLLVTRNFGSSVYGLVVLGLTLFMIASIAGKKGFDIALTRWVATGKYSKKEIGAYLGRASGNSLLLAGTLAAIVILAREWIALEVFKKPELGPYLFYAALTFPLWSQILIHIGLYRGLKHNTLFSFYNAFARFFAVVCLLLIGLWLYNDLSGVWVLKLHFLGVLLLFISCLIITHGHLRYPFALRGKIDWKAFSQTSRPILVTSLIFILLSWVDRFFVGFFQDEQTVAIYDVAAKLAILVSFNLDAVNSILAPKVVELYEAQQKDRLQQLVRFSANISGLISLSTLAFVLIGHDLLLGIFGPEYQEGWILLFVLAFGQLANCFSGSVGILLQMTGYQKRYQRIMIAGLVVNIVLNLLLAPFYGAMGVALATFASILTWNLYGIYFCKKKLGISAHISLPLRIFKSK